MPPAADALVKLELLEPDRRVVLKWSKNKGPRLVVHVDMATARYTTWLSRDSPSIRLHEVLTALPMLFNSDLTDEFKVALLTGVDSIYSSDESLAMQTLLTSDSACSRWQAKRLRSAWSIHH